MIHRKILIFLKDQYITLSSTISLVCHLFPLLSLKELFTRKSSLFVNSIALQLWQVHYSKSNRPRPTNKGQNFVLQTKRKTLGAVVLNENSTGEKQNFQVMKASHWLSWWGWSVPCGRSKVHLFFGGQWLLILHCWWLFC